MVKTICAIASGAVVSGICIIRISGPMALRALRDLGCFGDIRHKTATVCAFKAADGSIIDKGLFLFFKAPHSFTGEDVVELHLHGSIAVMHDIMAELLKFDYMRIAEPGEFSKRAFWNGKIDLTMAEGLSDLLKAQTSAQRRIAIRALSGEFEQFYEIWRRALIKIMSKLEAFIDFPDDDLPHNIINESFADIATLQAQISQYLNSARNVDVITHGFNIVIFGPPNSGKSTLINKLANQEVAIVSNIPGTTRDTINISLNIDGFMVNISDTAGIREDTEDVIEKMGIERAVTKLRQADMKILVLDLTDQIGMEEFASMYQALIDQDTVILYNKIDLVLEKSQKGLRFCNDIATVNFSAELAYGMEELLNLIKLKIQNINMEIADAHPTFIKMRYRSLLTQSVEDLQHAQEHKTELELACEYIRYAAFSIGQITGVIHLEEILDEIFSSFCIGK